MVSRPFLSILISSVLLVAQLSAASAQPPTELPPTVASIFAGAAVTDSITSYAPYDIWEFDAVQGDQFSADMQASNGLAPLLGLRDTSGSMLVRSDMFEDGTVQDADVNGVATLFFEIPSDGQYAIVASRVGTDEGTSSGDYTLLLTHLSSRPERENTYIDVVFRCQGHTVTSALAVELNDVEASGAGYTLSVYGIDGFDPVIRVGGDDGTGVAPCTLSEPAADAPRLDVNYGDGASDSFTAESITAVATTVIEPTDSPVLLTIGSRGGAGGRFFVSLSGAAISAADEADVITVRSGPRAKDEFITIWMLRAGLSRLDPMFMFYEPLDTCADIGLRSCVGTLAGASLTHATDTLPAVTTDRLDAVVRLKTTPTMPVQLAALSQNGRTTGAYTLWFTGVLP